MVKLLRLTSEDNCNFNVNMDADLIVEKDAEIALKNITFETQFEVLSIDGGESPLLNSSVEFGADTNDYGTSIAYLKSDRYTNANYLNFFNDMKKTLNNTLEPIVAEDTPEPTVFGQQFYGQFNIDNDQAKRAIDFRLSPVIVPLVTRNLQTLDDAAWEQINDFMSSSRDDTTDVVNVEVITEVSPTDAASMALVSKKGTVVAANTRSAYFNSNNPSTRWCNGSSVFWARISTLTDNGGDADTNGFEIGLSTYQGNDAQIPIPASSIYFALRCTRPQDQLQYINPNADFTINGTYVTSTGNSPTNPVPATIGTRDILMIQREKLEVSGGGDPNVLIKGYIFRNGIVPTQIFSYDLTKEHQNTSLYPYISFFGAKTTAVCSQPSITFDPFEIEGKSPNAFLELMKPQNGNNFAGVSSFEEIRAAYGPGSQTLVPDLKEEWYQSYGSDASSELKINRDILAFMGFSQSIVGDGTGIHTFRPTINTTLVPYGFSLVPANAFQSTLSDNYVVVIDSAKVVSYDCSKKRNPENDDVVGRRANIIATIPINNNTDGIVQFSANEVEYIDFDNKAPTAIRNLRLRVLDKSLQPIDTTGISVMTLLIKD